MGNGFNLVAAGQADANMEYVVKHLLGVDLRDESVDSFVGNLDEVGVWHDVDVVEVGGQPGVGEEGGDYFPRGVPGDLSERLCWLEERQAEEGTDGRTPNPVTYTVMGFPPRAFDAEGIAGIVVCRCWGWSRKQDSGHEPRIYSRALLGLFRGIREVVVVVVVVTHFAG